MSVRVLRVLCGLGILICLLATAVAGCAGQPKVKYPERAIDLVVAVPPGGGTDLLTRAVAEGLKKQLGQPVNVINRPGGGRVLGTESVMKAAPDGYTLLAESFATSSGQVVTKEWPFKLEERVYIARAALTPLAIIVRADRPWRSLNDLKGALLGAQPGELTWARVGGGSVADLAMMQFFDVIGLDPSKLKIVMHTGAEPAAVTVAGGHADFSSMGIETALSFASAGKVRILAVTSPERIKTVPDVPTTKEEGYPEVAGAVWMGLSGPVGLPEEVVTVLNAALQKALGDQSVIEALEKIKAVPAYLGPSEFKHFVFAEAEKVKKLVGGQ